MSININTPIEEYKIKDRSVFVKRDDLMGDGTELPPWGKLEAIQAILKSDLIDRSKPITSLTVSGSWSGWALSQLTKEMGIEYYMSYPDAKTIPESYKNMVEGFGAKLLPLRPNMMKIVYHEMVNESKKRKFQCLPYAFNCDVFIESLAKRVQNEMEFIEDNYIINLVVSGGSGVTPAAVMKGFGFKQGFDSIQVHKYARVITVSSIKTVKKVLLDYDVYSLDKVKVIKSRYDYYNMMESYETPFPCNQYWDKKAWHWLEKNIDSIDGGILFWNLGGIDTMFQ